MPIYNDHIDQVVNTYNMSNIPENLTLYHHDTVIITADQPNQKFDLTQFDYQILQGESSQVFVDGSQHPIDIDFKGFLSNTGNAIITATGIVRITISKLGIDLIANTDIYQEYQLAP